MIINWYQYAQLFCLVVGLYCLSGLKRFSLAAFLPLLVITNGLELVGRNYRHFGWANNYPVYNVYLVLATPLYLLLYWNMLALRGVTRGVYRITSLLLVFFTGLNFFFIQGINQFNTISLVLIMLSHIMLSCLVLFRLALQEMREINLLREPYFWINGVTLLFSLISLVILSLQPFIHSNRLEINDKKLYTAIMPAANVVLYLVYSYAFWLCQRQKNR